MNFSDAKNIKAMTAEEHREPHQAGAFMRLKFREMHGTIPLAERINSIKRVASIEILEGSFECQRGMSLKYCANEDGSQASIAEHVGLVMFHMNDDRITFAMYPSIDKLYDALSFGVVSRRKEDGAKPNPLFIERVNGDWEPDDSGDYEVWMDEAGFTYIVLACLHDTFVERMCTM